MLVKMLMVLEKVLPSCILVYIVIIKYTWFLETLQKKKNNASDYLIT